MIRSTAIVILEDGRGGRPLVQTADSILRSRRAPARTFIRVPPAGELPALADSVAARLNAAIVIEDPAWDVVHVSCLLFVRPGYMLDETFVEECEETFASDESVAAMASPVRLQTPDGSAHLEWRAAGITAAQVLEDTRSVPPAFAIRREVYDAIGGLDRSFGELAAYEFWLRLTLARHPIRLLDDALAARDIGLRVASDERRHLELFRAVIEKHAHAVESVMTDVLIGREVRFGRLRELHRELMAARDVGLAELDRIRAEAAHLAAFIAHHRRTGVDWGDLRRTDPISRDWGYDRGLPVDRRHIDDFLSAHSSDVRGTVLEVQEDEFVRAYGGPRVGASSVLDIDESNPRATILADLRCAPGIPDEQFDCIILTQTLHVIDDMAAALRECYRILKPGGVLLATVPAASRVCLEYGPEGDLWRATAAGVRTLFRRVFAPAALTVEEYGNVLTNVAFLHGLAASELTDPEFDARDPYLPALTGVRARKGAHPVRRGVRGLVLLYHRVEELWDVHGLAVPKPLFETQLAWLRQECDVMPLDVLLATPPEELPQRAVALTFDDGYVDNLTTIAPLLQAYELPATFFITTRWLDAEGEYWWDLLERVMLSTPRVPSSFALKLDGEVETLPTGTNEERLAAHRRVHEAMVHATLEGRDALAASVASWGGAGVPRLRPMLADEVRQLARHSRVTIGAHSVNHVALPNQAIRAVRQEIHDSCARLAKVTGHAVDLFAYPYGAYDRASAAVVRQSCRWGLSCDQRALGESFDAAAVPRVEVKRWDWLELASRLELLFDARAAVAARRAFMP